METKFISSSVGETLRQGLPNPESNRVKPAEIIKRVDLTDNVGRIEDDGKSEIAQPKISGEALEELVNELNQHIQSTNRELHFSVDKKYGRPIVSVIDKETDKVIRQIPAEVALQVADALDDATGALLSERA